MKGLVADIGGTNARFALADDNGVGYSDAATLSCGRFHSLQDAISQYLQDCGHPDISSACLAVAGPVSGDPVAVTNHHWRFGTRQLQGNLGLRHCLVINDFEAIGYAIPHLGEDDLAQLGDTPPPASGDTLHYAVVGPGTGLGAAAVTVRRGSAEVLSSEAGHLSFAPGDAAEIEIMRCLQSHFVRLSYERLLSGPGIVNLYQALAETSGTEPQNLTSELICQAAVERSNRLCVDALERFFAMLGAFAGDMVLAFNARDGVYIGGGIASRYLEQIQGSDFRTRFQCKGRYSDTMMRVPTWLILHENPGLLGAAAHLYDTCEGAMQSTDNQAQERKP